VNTESGETYIGSSSNLRRRFNQYFSLAYLTKNARSSVIFKALLKRGHSKFSLEILEYCKKEDILNREQYYIDTLKPSYNILKTAGSSLGYAHTTEAIEKIRVANLGRKHSDATLAKFKLRKHTAEAIAKMKLRRHSEESKEKIRNTIGIKVIVTDSLTNTTVEYNSMKEAAKAIDVSPNTIFERKKLQQDKGIIKPIKKRYFVEVKQI